MQPRLVGLVGLVGLLHLQLVVAVVVRPPVACRGIVRLDQVLARDTRAVHRVGDVQHRHHFKFLLFFSQIARGVY